MEQLEIPGTSPFEETGKHYHIGANHVGYLPESDVFCADTVQSAVEFFLSRLSDAYEEAQDEINAALDNGHGDDAWAALAREIDTIRTAASDGTQDLQRRVLANGGYSYMYTPPEGADVHYWIEPQGASHLDALEGKFSPVTDCEIWKEQEQ